MAQDLSTSSPLTPGSTIEITRSHGGRGTSDVPHKVAKFLDSVPPRHP